MPPRTRARARVSPARGQTGRRGVLGGLDDLRGQAAVIADEPRLLELLDDRVKQQSLPFQLVAQVVISQQIELELLGLFLVLVILLAELVPHDLYGLEALLQGGEQVADLAYLHVAPAPRTLCRTRSIWAFSSRTLA